MSDRRSTEVTRAAVTAAARHAGLVLDDVPVPVERTVRVNGVRLRVLDWGAPDAPPLLFLHGGGLHAHSWDLVCAALAPQYRCLAIDLRGHGDSDWAPDGDYRVATFAADVAEAWRQLRHDRRAPAVIGSSFGGVAALHAVEHGWLTPSVLVLVDITPDLNIERSHHIRAFTEPVELPTVEAFVERARAYNSRRPEELLRHSLRQNLREVPGGGWTWKYDPARMADADFAAMAEEHAALWDGLGRVTCPTVVVHGERSRIVTAAEAETFAAALPHGRAVHVAQAGHTVHGDNPRAFLAVLREALG